MVHGYGGGYVGDVPANRVNIPPINLEDGKFLESEENNFFRRNFPFWGMMIIILMMNDG